MNVYHPKVCLAVALAILVLLTGALSGCGDSQGVTTLTAHLAAFSDLIEDYKSTVAEDKTKQAELDAKIEAMTAKWTNMRNELGSEVTPQKMDDLVKQYDQLMLTLANFKKTIGS